MKEDFFDNIIRKNMVEDWDSFGAKAVDMTTIVNAKRIIRSLPRSVYVKDIFAEPDGRIGLQFKNNFFLSIDKDSNVRYTLSKEDCIIEYNETFENCLSENILKMFF